MVSQHLPRSDALAVLAGVAAAFGLISLALVTPAVPTALNWSGANTYFVVMPRESGAGGPVGPTHCTTLHVQFNASGPIDVWVAPGGAYSDSNGTLVFTQFWSSTGPIASGGLVALVPYSSTGYRVVLFNPSWSVTLHSMQFETAQTPC